MKVERKFKHRPVVVLTAFETVVNNCISKKEDLIPKRPGWADPFFTNLQTHVQSLFPLIGIDSRRATREATLALHIVIDPAIKDLRELKVQMDGDLTKARLAEIYNVLGFLQYYKTAVKADQLDLINLLAKFKTNITPELIAEITLNGIDPALITRISGYAKILQDANVTQETAKATQPELTAATVEQLNTMYTKIINICKICRTFFSNDVEKKNLFSYSKIVAAIIGGQPEPEPEVPEPNPVPQPN